jgi:hypothetical protein
LWWLLDDFMDRLMKGCPPFPKICISLLAAVVFVLWLTWNFTWLFPRFSFAGDSLYRAGGRSCYSIAAFFLPNCHLRTKIRE